MGQPSSIWVGPFTRQLIDRARSVDKQMRAMTVRAILIPLDTSYFKREDRLLEIGILLAIIVDDFVAA